MTAPAAQGVTQVDREMDSMAAAGTLMGYLQQTQPHVVDDYLAAVVYGMPAWQLTRAEAALQAAVRSSCKGAPPGLHWNQKLMEAYVPVAIAVIPANCGLPLVPHVEAQVRKLLAPLQRVVDE